MAQITFTAFVEDWTQNNPQHPGWGMKTAEPHRKKDGDQWVTVGRTFRTVKGGYQNGGPVQIDFTQFARGSRVKVVGVEVTEMRESNGKKYYDLVVKATSVSTVESNSSPDWDGTPSGGQQPRGGVNSGSGNTSTSDAWNAPQSAADDDQNLPF